ncbi:MAG: flavin reductase family protein [Candidatus Verstraetearchaeota archaeon]|nr:flavin reductase family protein [Candidatus Verstraetearchaeota archaeon]
MSIPLISALDYIPHPLVVVTAGDPENPKRRGGMAAAWVSRVSWSPPLVMVSIAPERFTLELIREFKEFAINVVSEDLERAVMDVFGTLSGRDTDKFARAGVGAVSAKKIKAPVIREAAVVIECKVLKEVEAGDHIMVVGEVIEAYRSGVEGPLLLWHRGSVTKLK